MTFDASARRIAEASALVPGGVNSNFRFGISPTPLVIERGEGAYLFDIDGNRLIDYYLGMGPMILGHNPPAVIDAVRRQLDTRLLFAAQSEIEYEAARPRPRAGALGRKGALQLLGVRGGAGRAPAGARGDRAVHDREVRGPLSRLVRQRGVERRARRGRCRKPRCAGPCAGIAGPRPACGRCRRRDHRGTISTGSRSGCAAATSPASSWNRSCATRT